MEYKTQDIKALVELKIENNAQGWPYNYIQSQMRDVVGVLRLISARGRYIYNVGFMSDRHMACLSALTDVGVLAFDGEKWTFSAESKGLLS